MKKTLGILVIVISVAAAGGYFFFRSAVQEIVIGEEAHAVETGDDTEQEVAEAAARERKAREIAALPAWERKKDVQGETLRIGMITDTHLSSKADGAGRALPNKTSETLEHFRENMSVFDPAFIMHLGDLIDGTDVPNAIGRQETRLIAEAFSKIQKPVYWALGNHDLRSVTRAQFQEDLGIDYTNTFFDQGPYRFIILDANFDAEGLPHTPISTDYIKGLLPADTLAWLAGALDTDQHVYVFMHHSAIPRRITNKNPINNKEEVREMFSKYNVAAVFNGHIEKRVHTTIDGVDYYALPGIAKNDNYQGSFYELTLSGKAVDVVMYYDQKFVDAPIREGFFERSDRRE